MNIEDFTILFQGKIYDETQSYIDFYKKLNYKIIISTYDNTITNANKIILNNISNIDNASKCYKTGSTPSGKYQVFTTLNGLLNIETKYTIKIRSDECYNLEKLINLFSKDDDKIVMHNLFYRPIAPQWGNHHISDKLLIGKTENLINMFLTAYKILIEEKIINYNPKCIEDFLGYCYVFYKNNYNENNMNTHNEMEKYFDFVNFTELAPFKMKFNTRGIDPVVNALIYTQDTIYPEYHLPWVELMHELAKTTIRWK